MNIGEQRAVPFSAKEDRGLPTGGVMDPRRGFTLIEMAIVLVVIGILVGMTIPLLSELSKHRHYLSTQRGLDEIQNALVGYAGMHWRFPYADTNGDGLGDSGQTVGTLPYVDLGLGAVDAWRNAYHYHINSRLVSTTTLAAMCTALSSIASGESPELRFSPSGAFSPQAVIVISKGENGSLDGENGDGDGSYESLSPTGSFDDLVGAVTPGALHSRLACASSGGGACISYTVVNRRGNTVGVIGGSYPICTAVQGGGVGSFVMGSGQTILLYNNSGCTGGSVQILFADAASADADGDCLVSWTAAGGGSLADE
ncbi:MAG: type II secretion system protein [Thermodesulfobacteriota bacterium]